MRADVHLAAAVLVAVVEAAPMDDDHGGQPVILWHLQREVEVGLLGAVCGQVRHVPLHADIVRKHDGPLFPLHGRLLCRGRARGRPISVRDPAVKRVGDSVHPLVESRHLVDQRRPGNVSRCDDALVGVTVGGIDLGVVGIVVGVAVPVPAHAVPRSQQTEGEVLVEEAAIPLGTDEPAGAAGVAQAAVGPLGVVLGDHERPARFAGPHRHLLFIRRPGSVVVHADHVAIPAGGAEDLGQIEHRLVEPDTKEQVVRIDCADGGRDDREVAIDGKLEKRRAVDSGDPIGCRSVPISAGIEPVAGGSMARIIVREAEIVFEHRPAPGHLVVREMSQQQRIVTVLGQLLRVLGTKLRKLRVKDERAVAGIADMPSLHERASPLLAVGRHEAPEPGGCQRLGGLVEKVMHRPGSGGVKARLAELRRGCSRPATFGAKPPHESLSATVRSDRRDRVHAPADEDRAVGIDEPPAIEDSLDAEEARGGRSAGLESAKPVERAVDRQRRQFVERGRGVLNERHSRLDRGLDRSPARRGRRRARHRRPGNRRNHDP